MILQTIDQFKAVIPTTVQMENFSDFEPYVRSAELWIKSNVLGKDLYDAVVLLADDSDSDIDLIQLCQSVIGNHAYWDAIPFLDLVHTDSGFAVISATNKVPASKERVERLREQCLIRRDAEVETLITYLEEHTEYHDDWKSSPVYSVLTGCLIRTATELREYGNWEGSRRDFLRLRPQLIATTMTKLEPVFSKDYIDELIEKQRDTELTSDDDKVLTLLKYALANLAIDNEPVAKRVAADALRYIDGNIEQFATYTSSMEYAARILPWYENTSSATIYSSLF